MKSSREAFWNQALSFLLSWDGYLYPDLGGYYSTTAWSVPHWSEYGPSFGESAAYPRLALEKAAKAGHPMAQYYLANALGSGIWPVPESLVTDPNNLDGEPLEEQLQVFDEWIPQSHGHGKNHPQVIRSYILWHMAAMAGNVDAAMTLGYRMEHYQNDDSNVKGTCEDSLPYYQAAANGILDQLETSPHSRAKVVPPMDKHILAQVHMHGGTSSQLDWNNKPDEALDALQYYHLKATTVPWTMKSRGGGSDDDDGTNESGGSSSSKGKNPKKRTRKAATMDVDGVDISAAYTLAHLYHYGFRGVEQNLTKSLEYYEIAGTAGHWESSGQACTFFLWGMGMDKQDVHEALTYCRMGAPMGVEGCRVRHEKILSSSKEEGEEIVECDDQALNGLGLLHLMGIKGSLEVDLATAEKYFALAKELGNADAHYNLAMMWLGWKTHFKHIEELADDGVSGTDGVGFGFSSKFPLPDTDKKNKASSSSKNDRFVLHVSKLGNNQVFKGPIQDDVTNAIKLLSVAANKGHVQAKHRLAMIYAEGLRLQTNALKYESVKKDCDKAKGLFQWIVENASLSRSRRLRTAYKEYVAGNLERSLRNYLAAAETGSSVGQMNAAFLLERGTCLGLSQTDCAKASLRMWKAAAARGSAEACLRVGDFYYYGRLRGEKQPHVPFAWIQYILYPEKYMPGLFLRFVDKLWATMQSYLGTADQTVESAVEGTCEAGEDGICANPDLEADQVEPEDQMEADLSMAAHYYHVAVEKHQSSRANYNLGFMHEWGLGLNQDFPLAKRHYDLAAKMNPIAVQLALMALSRHEAFLRGKMSFMNWWNGQETFPSRDDVRPPQTVESVGEPVPLPRQQPFGKTNRKTREEIIMSHLFNVSTVVILVLIAIVIQIYTIMRSRQRRR